MMTKLMIVDDSNIIRNRIARLMGNPRLPGISIIGLAKDGAEAVDMCRRNRPDLVTLDLTMPNMDGIECVEKMMHIDPAISVLVVSALSDKATAISALKKGARGFLHKPFNDEQLVDALLELME
ncbi:MAG: response regulator [Chitinivorax sp.]|mgnify:FL=1